MEAVLLLLGITGALAGVVHVLAGPDHLAAVAPFAVDQRSKNWLVGLFWGIGHTGGVWLVGILAFLLRELLPLDSLSQWSERFVGVVLIGLGIWGIRKAFQTRIHYHEHRHDGTPHAHFHVHSASATHTHHALNAHQHVHAPVGIGLLHGLAGSSHLLGILPALALPTRSGAVIYVAGFGLGSIVAMISFSWILGKLVRRLMAWSDKSYRWVQIAFSSTAIGVGLAWLVLI